MKRGPVRNRSGTPEAIDFTSGDGTPIVVDTLNKSAYAIDANNSIFPLGGAGSINVSAGTASANLTNLVFSNNGSVSFGLSGSTITASVAAAGGALTNIKLSAGTSSALRSDVTFSNSNGVSFGLNGGVLTATVATNYLTTAMASNRGSDFVQATAAFAGTNASGTIASNGISVSVGNYLTTAMASNAVTLSNIKVSAGTLSANRSDITFANSNGVSFGLNTNGVITGSVATNYLTTARASNDAIGLNTAQSNVTWTVNSSGLSFDARGYAGTGTTFAGANVSGSMTLNSAGLNLSVSADAAGGGVTVSEFEPILGYSLLTNSALGQNRLYFVAFDLEQNLNAYRVNFFHSIATTLQASNSTNSAGVTFSAALYTRMGGASTERISSFWSASWYIRMSNSSNTQVQVTHPLGISNSTAVSTGGTTMSNAAATTYLANSVAGYRVIPMPISSTLTPGRYWLAVAQSTQSSNAIGVLRQSVVLQTNANNIAYRPFGTSSAASNASFYPTWPGEGTYSATSGAFPGSVALTTADIRASPTLTLPYFNFSGYTTGTNVA